MSKIDSIYKKKSLKFSGFTRELKKKEVEVAREASRHKRLSTLRDFSDLETQENYESKTSIKGVKKTRIPTREDMLKRWKEEKLMKKQKEQLNKKPIFKVGFIPKIASTLQSQIISGNKTNNSFHKTFSFKIPDASQLAKSRTDCRKQESQIAKAPVKSVNPKAVAGSLKLPSAHASSLKPPIQKSLHATGSLKSPATHISLKPLIQKSKPITTSHQFAASTLKSTVFKQISSTISVVKTHSQTSKSSSVPKTVNPTSKLPMTTGIKQPSTGTKRFQKPSNVKSETDREIQKMSVKEPSGVPKKYPNQLKPGNKRADFQKNSLCNEDKKLSMIPDPLFPCDISCIESDSSVRNSFAPTNFIFCPPTDISDFSFCNPSLIFSKIKSQQCNQRTSSPLKSLEQTSNDSASKLLDYNQKNESSQCFQVTLNVPSGSNVSRKETENSFLKVEISGIEDALFKEKQNKVDVIKKLNETDDFIDDKHSETKEVFVEEKQNKTADAFVEETHNKTEDFFAEEKQNLIDLKTSNTSEKSFLPVKTEQSPSLSKLIDLDEVRNSFNNILESKQNESTTSLTENRLIENTLPLKEIFLPNSLVGAEISVLLPSNNFSVNNSEEKADHLNESTDIPANDVFSLTESLKSFQFHESVSSERKASNIILSNTKYFQKSVRSDFDSINESIETKSLNTTPKSCRKQNQIDENFTPRRSARLSQKLRKSSSCDSVFDAGISSEKLKVTEVLKPRNTEQALERTGFEVNSRKTVRSESISLRKQSLLRNCGRNIRRSARLSAKISSSFESLLHVERPSIMGSFDIDEIDVELPVHTNSHSNITYDFEELHLEDIPNTKSAQNPGINRVSLLYTPQRPSTRYSSIKEDLMLFSPL